MNLNSYSSPSLGARIAALLLLTVLAAPTTHALTVESVDVEVSAPSAQVAISTSLAVSEMGSAKLLLGVEWSGFATVPSSEGAPRFILLRSTDETSMVVGILRLEEESSTDWSGFCLVIGPSFSFGSISASFVTTEYGPQPAPE